MGLNDYDSLVLCQTNKNIIETVARRLKFDIPKALTTIDQLVILTTLL